MPGAMRQRRIWSKKIDIDIAELLLKAGHSQQLMMKAFMSNPSCPAGRF